MALVAALVAIAPARAAEAPAPGACRRLMGPESALQVTPGTRRPVVVVQLNGRPVRALIDTGADTSLVGEDAARRLGLPLLPAPGYRAMGGVGGTFQPYLVNVRLTLGGATTPVRVLAGGQTRDVDLLIGDDLLRFFDVEFDLAHGAIRLMTFQHCRDQDMAYWADGYSEAPLLAGPFGDDHLMVPVKVNGRLVRTFLDSGASTSLAALSVARQAGVKLPAEVEEGRGLGARGVAVAYAPLDSFEVGGERINHTRLTFGDLFAGDTYDETGSHLPQRMMTNAEMLLGADFLAAHRVLVSTSHHKIFFTYNGGPVFAPAAGAQGAAPAAPHTGV